MQNTPQHVAIIMDGNRRWAQAKGLKTVAGHKAGIEALEKVVKEAARVGVKHLTVYALSTENLKNRSKLEIGSLFSLIQAGFIEKLPVLKKEGVRVNFFGEIDSLPSPVKKILSETKKQLQKGKRLQLNIALNYGARMEILAAVKAIDSTKKITEKEFSLLLDTSDIVDPELIIRTGGEQRLSNFLLWQAAYSELYFTKQLWPDFDAKSFQKALREYSKRKRNFGV